MKLFSKQTHGILDYLSVGTLLALPRVFHWNENVTRLLTTAAFGTLGYSLLTRYRYGAVKVLPMKAHLGLDFMSGVMLCAAPLVFTRDTDKQINSVLVGFGLFETVVAMTTEAEE
jgi:hypothetical protein